VGRRLIVIFEGRDAAGKGGAITRVTQYRSPRVARFAALPAPTDARLPALTVRKRVMVQVVPFDRLLHRGWATTRLGVDRRRQACSAIDVGQMADAVVDWRRAR
jgi:polyphosphate kinase 2 (PPK2 family)